MARQKGHAHGGKVSGRHTTVTEAAQKVVLSAEKLPEVTKICLGIIKRARSGQFGIKLFPIHGGLRAVISGSQAVQHLFIYTNNIEATESALNQLHQEHR